MLHLVEGQSGSGKTRYVTEKLCELARAGEDKLLYLIPEQSSFEAEKDFLKRLGAGLAVNVKVMSFTRLYEMVMRETGLISGVAVDDGTRKILMSLSLEDCEDELELYKKQAGTPQLSQLMLDAVKEFKSCNINTKKLRSAAEKTKGTDLSKKLEEISLVHDVYQAHIERSYIDSLDNNARLQERLEKVNFFKGYTIAADGFSGFTAGEQKIIDLLMKQAKDFYLTLCMESESRDDVFFTVRRTKERIELHAELYEIGLAPTVQLKENHRTHNKELNIVRNGIYRVSKNEKIEEKSSPDEERSVTVAAASDIFEECEYVASRIKELALSGKCRYRDIAVVCRSADKYLGVIDTIFDNYQIPYFMSKPEPIDRKPVFLLAQSAFEYALDPSDADNILNIAKSGLTGIDSYDAAMLENYVYTWSIRGRAFRTPFENDPDGYTQEMSKDAQERLSAINDTRERLISPLAAFTEKLSSAENALDISKAAYELLIDYGVPEQLRLREDEDEVRLWKLMMDVLDKMYLSIGERAVTVKRYFELFRQLIRSYDISSIPSTLDQVIIGTANSVRLLSPFAVFVIGAVNGEFPHDPVASGVFNDAERRSLINMEMPMYDAVAELYMQEKFLVYTAVSAPTDILTVTYPTSELSGAKLTPSSIVTGILKLLPYLELKNISSLDPLEKICSDKSAFEYCALNYIKDDPLSVAVREYFADKEGYAPKLRAIERSLKKQDMMIEDKTTAAALFGHDKSLSASQIESFFTCRFRYFINYGLKLKERKKAKLDSIEYGTLIHYLLENIVRIYKENDYERISDERLEELLDELLKKYIKAYMGGEDDKSDRFKYLFFRLKKSTAALIGHLMSELEQSEFKPVDFEVGIGRGKIKAYEVKDENGNNVRVYGVIDRVDVMEKDKASYVRIIDYKTGHKEFRLSDVLFGLNMQMLIYLSALSKSGAKEYGENIRPSGVLYVPSTVASVIVPPEADDKMITDEHDKKLRMNGLLLDEGQVLRGMESELKGKYIPVSADKSGNIKKSCKNYMVSSKQLNTVFELVEKKIRNMSEMLDKGDIAAIPTGNDSFDPCSYCSGISVCGHSGSDKCKLLKKFDNNEVIEKAEKGEEE